MKILSIFISILLMTAVSHAAAGERDCRRGHIALNVEEKTDREGFLHALQILSQPLMRDSTSIANPPFDGRTGSFPMIRTIGFLLRDPYPNAVDEASKKETLAKINQAVDELTKIPGVVVHCGELPAGTEPRLSGGF